jgi:hypothetical protein
MLQTEMGAATGSVDTAPRWNTTIYKLLERVAYQVHEKATGQEICARIDMSEREVLDVLEANWAAAIECVYRMAEMLNIPAADLINPSKDVFQCFSIYGGRPRTVSLTFQDGNLREYLNDLPPPYAEDLDGRDNPSGYPQDACRTTFRKLGQERRRSSGQGILTRDIAGSMRPTISPAHRSAAIERRFHRAFLGGVDSTQRDFLPLQA